MNPPSCEKEVLNALITQHPVASKTRDLGENMYRSSGIPVQGQRPAAGEKAQNMNSVGGSVRGQSSMQSAFFLGGMAGQLGSMLCHSVVLADEIRPGGVTTLAQPYALISKFQNLLARLICRPADSSAWHGGHHARSNAFEEAPEPFSSLE